MTIIAWIGWVDDCGSQEEDDGDDGQVATA